MIPRRLRAPVEVSPKSADPATTTQSPPSANDQIVGVSQLMLTSLPPMMSGADVYMRQFYRSDSLPTRRFLPLRGL